MEELKQLQEEHRVFTNKRDWDRFQNPKNLVMALSVEAAELVDVFIWLTNNQSEMLNSKQIEQVKDEMGDIFIYLLRLADILKIDLIKAAQLKMKKNREKYSVKRGKELARKIDEGEVGIEK